MARNDYGVICDMCGEYSNLRNAYFKLTLPIWESNINNSVKRVDFCFNCYKNLRKFLAEDFLKNKERSNLVEH